MKQLKKCILLFASIFLLLLPKKIVNACGFFVSPGEYRFWLLQPDLTNQPDLTPFFFATTYLYKGNEFPFPDASSQRNVEEWFHSLNHQVPQDDIDDLLNNTDPQEFFSNQKILQKKNRFLWYLLQPGHQELYEYILLSKKVEQIAANPDPWEERHFPVGFIDGVIKEGWALLRKTHSPFIRLRTAFQLIRLYGWNGQPEPLRETYLRFVDPVKTDSWIKSAALYQCAIHSKQCDYLLSQVFDRGDYHRAQCLVRFDPAGVYESLQSARNAHEKTVLFTMQVMNKPGRCLPYIKTIYAIEPGYKELPFLLLREINKVEDWLVTNKVTGFNPAAHPATAQWFQRTYNKSGNYRADQAYAKQLSAFIDEVVRQGKSHDPALLRLFAAHLQMVQENYLSAAEHLRAAGRYRHLPDNVRSQIRINSFLLSLETGLFNDGLQKEFMRILSLPAKTTGIYDNDIMKDQLILYTARKLLAKGERVKGFMLLSKTRRALGELDNVGRYKTLYQVLEEEALPADYDGILKVLEKPHKTPFENFVAGGYFHSSEEYYESGLYSDTLRWNRFKLLDCKATWLIRSGNLSSALQVLESIPDTYWKQEPYKTFVDGDPFFVNINNPHNYAVHEKQHYNKREILEKMVKLEKLSAGQGRAAAEASFHLANAWYNFGYFGKDWILMKQWWSVNEMDTPEDGLGSHPFDDVYYGCTRATDLYLRALKQTTDEKLGVLCCFMAGKCRENYTVYQAAKRSRQRQEVAVPPARPNPYISLLKTKGIDENYYQELVQECAVYSSYINRYNR